MKEIQRMSAQTHRSDQIGPEVTRSKELRLTVICPCYNESEVIQLFYQELVKVLNSLEAIDIEIIFVDDGSTDDTLLRLNHIAQEDTRVRIGSFSRNFGHQIALTAGLDHATGYAILKYLAFGF